MGALQGAQSLTSLYSLTKALLQALYGALQKLLTRKVAVKRMRARDMRRPKKLVIYTKCANHDLSESYCYLVFAIDQTIYRFIKAGSINRFVFERRVV